jgi:tryptophan-rich sensory protein
LAVKKTVKGDVALLSVCILVCELTGVLGSVFSVPVIPTWYAQLNKPIFSPPNWLFMPVWTVLYALIGYAAYLVLKEKSTPVRNHGLNWFGAQLIFNLGWSILFFGAESPLLGMVAIALLWASAVVTATKFKRVSEKAFWLFVPYVAWVTYAAFLNYVIWTMN